MDSPLHSTPYADVNAVLQLLLQRIQPLLGAHFLGMYLCGSLALGDFDPDSSDIDLIVVTDAELGDEFVVRLGDMHALFAASPSPWTSRIEVVYIPRDTLLHPTRQSVAHYPQIEKGTGLFKAPLESGWLFQCSVLREHGIAIAGPDPRTLIDPISADDIRRAAAVAADAIAGEWLRQAQHDPDWLAWMKCREHHAFVVLTLCRLLYSLDAGSVASKPAAAHWAQQKHGALWITLIAEALAGQHERGDIPATVVDETIAFIQYTLERSRSRAVSPQP
ncbi:MAG: aminoglycoside adenylyltransferase domain-containing protein [Ktedonobacterales bacterium]